MLRLIASLLLLVPRPKPIGDMGRDEREFDALFGAYLADFIDGGVCRTH